MHLGLKVKRGLTGEKDGEKGRGGIRHIQDHNLYLKSQGKLMQSFKDRTVSELEVE